MGKPVVGSRVGVAPEVLEDGATALLVPAGEDRELAAALARLLDDGALRARLGAAGRARVLARYTAARMAEGTLACYEDRPCA
jgi:glycosyltransferase involved in cell wall biosynthesis